MRRSAGPGPPSGHCKRGHTHFWTGAVGVGRPPLPRLWADTPAPSSPGVCAEGEKFRPPAPEGAGGGAEPLRAFLSGPANRPAPRGAGLGSRQTDVVPPVASQGLARFTVGGGSIGTPGCALACGQALRLPRQPQVEGTCPRRCCGLCPTATPGAVRLIPLELT